MNFVKAILYPIGMFIVFFIILCVVLSIPIAFIGGIALLFIDIKLSVIFFLIGIGSIALFGTVFYIVGET